MRLAYITAKFPFGPTEAFFEPEVRQLARMLEEVIVYPTRPVGRHSFYGELGSTDAYVAMFDPSVLWEAFAALVTSPARVAKALRTVLFGSSRPMARLKNILVFPHALALARDFRRRGVDHVHVQWLTTPATTAYVAATVAGLPWSASAHQHDIFFENLVAEKAHDAAFVRVISERNLRHLVERIAPADAARCHTVHLGVDVPVRSASLSQTRGTLHVLCAARLWPFKGHPYLIRALRAVVDAGVDVRCDLAGDGELRPQIEALVLELGLADVVTFRGHVPHATLLEELRAGRYDLSVLASTEDPGEHEGIPVAMMEAMAAGVPVVATVSGSLRELIEDGVSGVLVPHKNAAALAAATVRLAGDVDARRALGEAGRARVCAEFDTTVTTRRLVDLVYGKSA